MDNHSPPVDKVALSPDRALRLLAEGEVQVEGLIPWSSNATLLVTVKDGDESALAVYKPQRGERPLWDFPHGTLGMREVVSYRLCQALGWGLVPPTLLRQGPYGLGSLQAFIHAQDGAHFFTIRDQGRHTADLKRLAAFDVVANNADRKGGHCLLDGQGHLWAIDNALTFHAEPKLRTVIWDFVDQPLPARVLEDLEGLRETLRDGSPLSQELASLLSAAELEALRHRVRRLIRAGRFPQPGPGHPVPWPLL